MRQYRKRATANGTQHLVTTSCSVKEIVISPDAVGSAWTLTIKDLASPAFVLVPVVTLVVATAPGPIIIKFETPVLMQDGVDAVFAGTAAGSCSVWVTADKGLDRPT